jgi:methylthioribose-1-phosphate isomerase
MRIGNTSHRSITALADASGVSIIDQTVLPHQLTRLSLKSLHDCAHAIAAMQVRGAPLIGITGAYGLALALREGASDALARTAHATLNATRPTAVNLRWALDRVLNCVLPLPLAQRADAAWALCNALAEEDVATNRAIGEHGLTVLRSLKPKCGDRLQIMTHCNAGWLATVDWGTALAPIYLAHDAGVPLHVWVSETRPRNQGAALTAWELAQHGVPHTLIADNASGHLIQRAEVDAVMVGADRITARGDVANKIGTYMKALAAHAHGVPFYVAAPWSTIDLTLQDGVSEIPIESRSGDEVLWFNGARTTPVQTQAFNPAFDVTPAHLLTAIITERGTLAPGDVQKSSPSLV